MEDFEDVIVLGEERPTTLATPSPTLPETDLAATPDRSDLSAADTPDPVTTIGVFVPDDLPTDPTPEARELFADAVLAYSAGDFTEAFAQARRASEGGSTRAQVLAGNMLFKGEAPIRDDSLAVKLLTPAADVGDIDALRLLAQLALEGRGGLRDTDAAPYLKRAADLGDAESMRALSTVAARGLGVQPSSEAARAWEDTAAASGDAESLFRRGARLRESDPISAFDAFSDAAEAGHAEAAYEAAILLSTTPAIPPDEARVARLMRQAATNGHPPGMADYGMLVYQGAGVPRDIDAAATWFRQSAEAGDAEGMFLWAFTLAKGEGVAQDFEESYYWLLRSGESGVADYDAARSQLRERLEANVDSAVLERARARLAQ